MHVHGRHAVHALHVSALPGVRAHQRVLTHLLDVMPAAAPNQTCWEP